MEMMSVVAKNIKRAREKVNLSQDELGKIIGLTQAQISKIEKGKSDTTITNLSLLAEALNISIFDLIGEQQKEGSHAHEKKQQNEIMLESINHFAASVGFATELAANSTHEQRARAARMLRSALTILEDSEAERYAEPKSGGAA
jgi:transcriptional regulator with XRE-family HTH domain